MKLRKFILIWIFVLLYNSTSALYAQHRETVYFPKGSYRLVPGFRGNETLADKRGKSISFVDSIVFVTCLDEDWDYLHRMVQESHDIPNKAQVLEIFSNTSPNDNREELLKQLESGTSWNYMVNNFFSNMRGVELVVTLAKLESVSTGQLDNLILEEKTEPIEDTLHLKLTPLTTELKPLPQNCPYSWYLKTDVAALGMLVANISAEVDLGRKISVSIPLYYSAWDYFSRNIKFRTIALQPELRYWLSEKQKGFYAAVHAGIAWYNMATGGDLRIQDKDGDTPAIGGGISVGYRMPLLKHNSRWMIELGVGAGAYAVEYNKFYNIRNGALCSSKKKTYIGPDQLSVNLIYQMSKQRRNIK